jgi:hypothetical protein
MSISKTRFNRFAQVIARDGMYAGFAGAKTGLRSPFFGGRLVGLIRKARSLTFASPGRCYLGPGFTIWCKHAMKTSQVNPRLWNE